MRRFLCNELSQAAASLPETRNKSNLIRATKGLALSIRAKILILAASPLFNSEDTPIYNLKNDKGELLITPGYSEENNGRKLPQRPKRLLTWEFMSSLP